MRSAEVHRAPKLLNDLLNDLERSWSHEGWDAASKLNVEFALGRHVLIQPAQLRGVLRQKLCVRHPATHASYELRSLLFHALEGWVGNFTCYMMDMALSRRLRTPSTVSLGRELMMDAEVVRHLQRTFYEDD